MSATMRRQGYLQEVVRDALQGADREWRSAESVRQMVLRNSSGWLDQPTVKEVATALNVLSENGHVEEISGRLSGTRLYRVRHVKTAGAKEPEKPEPQRPSCSWGLNDDGTWFFSADGLSEVEARCLAQEFGEGMSRRS